MGRYFGTILLAAGLMVGFVGTATAVGSEEVVELRLDVPSGDSDDPDVRAATRKKIADRVIGRIRTRLDAAQVKYSNVHVSDEDGAVIVEADPDFDRQLLEGVVLPPGELEVRPLMAVGARWTDLSGKMPKGVELRPGDDPLDQNSAFAWSNDRQRLIDFVEGIDMPEAKVSVYPKDGGWRTVTLGETLVTHDEVESSKIRRVQTGAPFVTLTLNSGAGTRFGSQGNERDRRLAVVLDGEVVAVVKAQALAEQKLSIPTPDHLSGGEATMRWARQVGGRLAAPMPVDLVPMRE